MGLLALILDIRLPVDMGPYELEAFSAIFSGEGLFGIFAVRNTQE